MSQYTDALQPFVGHLAAPALEWVGLEMLWVGREGLEAVLNEFAQPDCPYADLFVNVDANDDGYCDENEGFMALEVIKLTVANWGEFTSLMQSCAYL